MVDSTIEFCRIAWSLSAAETSNISVMVANEIPTYVVDSASAGQMGQIMDTFALVQPRKAVPVNRLQLALDRICTDIKSSKMRICLLLMNKNIDDDARLFRNDDDSVPSDIRAMIHRAVAKSSTIKEAHVDVLRLCPFPESTPPHTLNQQLSGTTTVSIYNIPNRYGALKNAMCHLAQLYFNISVLQISGFPADAQSCQELQVDPSRRTVLTQMFYGASEKHNNDMSSPSNETPIDDPKYLESRIKHFIYVKQSTQGISEDVGWCTCMHPSIPVHPGDTSTNNILNLLLQGNEFCLSIPGHAEPTKWTHTLQAEGGNFFLRCLDVTLDNDMTTSGQRSLDFKVVKQEDPLTISLFNPSRVEEFSKNLLLPITFDNVFEAIPLQPYDPYEYTSQWSILPIEPKPTTTVYAERITRWYSCFRSSTGTDRFPIKHENSLRLEDIAYEVTIGSPNQSEDHIPHADAVISTAESIVSTLAESLSGSRKRIFTAVYNKDEILLTTKKLLVALYLVAKRFSNISQSHAKVCRSLKNLLDEKIQPQASMDYELKVEPGLEDVKANESSESEMAWQQVTQYQNMSLREKEESVFTAGPSSETPGRGMKSRGKSMVRGTRKTIFNPNFKQGQASPAPPRKYPSPSVMTPYLEPRTVTVEEKRAKDKKRKNRLGQANCLLSAYWSAQRAQKLGSSELKEAYDGKTLVYEKNQWKRVQKEVDGRMPK
ncbi:hypothetical protein BX666DRAFT_871609 [Dichotomocladium elegans]|nr:hypothetical protein BX666DRAFT_871609 [Dichotomocladium elegans]